MTEEPEITYFALLTDEGVPAGLIRRTQRPLVPLDESLRRDLSWRPTEFLRKYQLGHNENDYRKISADEAQALIESWQVKWRREDAD
ncbi:hypothetical protein BayCH28_08265 [Mycolicibacterium sp. CH28]|uniref:hypothetical protein n=1 Tax=Mycolicibacterium sp. CH28 TaxID=2512237 RepID=UPI0010813278|nr:hypothetical protein [Mycolicibacterium sp. CH28]TGD89326.1 hypothetical protein BayCH28_08265 [Mycolicibacterium sp. CH28]